MKASDIHDAVLEAEQRIRPHVVATPLRHSFYLSRLTGANVLCKLENVQLTGSFKARGAANKILQLTGTERKRGVVTASSGNHGTAVAAIMARLGGSCVVFVPETTPRVKLEAMKTFGAEVRQRGTDSGLCEAAAIEFAKASGLTYVSPYDDPAVIAGQGTIGAEIARAAPDVAMTVIAVGGGGLTSGVAGYLKAVNPQVRIIGASPENDHSMLLSARAGHAVVHEGAKDTLSDGTAGSVQPGAITIPLCAALVDDWPAVGEAEIANAVCDFLAYENMVIEGAAGVAVAAFLQIAAKEPESVTDKTVAILICGGRIDPDKLIKILKRKD
ncbi:MAG: pyridoxal-phosphate dependent enzyme [Aestuariivirga sp.]